MKAASESLRLERFTLAEAAILEQEVTAAETEFKLAIKLKCFELDDADAKAAAAKKKRAEDREVRQMEIEQEPSAALMKRMVDAAVAKRFGSSMPSSRRTTPSPRRVTFAKGKPERGRSTSRPQSRGHSGSRGTSRPSSRSASRSASRGRSQERSQTPFPGRGKGRPRRRPSPGWRHLTFSPTRSGPFTVFSRRARAAPSPWPRFLPGKWKGRTGNSPPPASKRHARRKRARRRRRRLQDGATPLSILSAFGQKTLRELDTRQRLKGVHTLSLPSDFTMTYALASALSRGGKFILSPPAPTPYEDYVTGFEGYRRTIRLRATFGDDSGDNFDPRYHVPNRELATGTRPGPH